MNNEKKIRRDVRRQSAALGLVLSGVGLMGCAADATQEEGVAALEQDLTAADVFGFENAAQWTVSSGTKTSITGGTQGTKSLGVANTYYSQITSASINSVGFVSSTLALDVKLPSAASWGDLRVVLRAPSKGIWYGDLGAKSLASLGSGSFQTAQFTVPTNILTALQGNPSDLTVELVLNGAIGATPIAFDNLRFVGQNPGQSVVEIRVPLADDFAYLEVNGVLRRIGYWGQPPSNSFVDVTKWFTDGINHVRLLAMNGGLPQGLQFELRVDGTVVESVNCDSVTCPPVEGGVFVDRVLNVPELELPVWRTVQITSPTPGKIYIDDEFTGLTTPATIDLPQTSYRLGLGVSNAANTTGSFYEEELVVGPTTSSVVLGDTAPIAARKVNIAVIPVRSSYVEETNGTSTITNADAARFGSQMHATADTWVGPFTYGLNDWDVTVFPIEEQLIAYPETYEHSFIHSCDLLQNPKYSNVLNQYDAVFFHVGLRDVNGNDIGRGEATMAGRCGQIHAETSRELPNGSPLPVVLHEMLHSYEAHQTGVLHHYNGVEGLHGAEEHGFNDQGPEGWNEWYRLFFRGQGAEVTPMRIGTNWPAPPANPDYWIGVFKTVRHGFWLTP